MNQLSENEEKIKYTTRNKKTNERQKRMENIVYRTRMLDQTSSEVKVYT